MSRPPEASVVLCTYNRAQLLVGALESLSAQEGLAPEDLELLVVDDASTDATRAVATAPTIRLVTGPGRGIAAARNVGVAAARGRWVAFFDDDQRASPGWLAALLEGARRSGALLVAGPRVLCPTGPVPSSVDWPLEPRLQRLLGEEAPQGSSGFLTGPHLPNTGNVLVLRELFMRLGGFDESLVEGGEDTEWFVRARRAGLPIWWADGARVEHLLDSSRLDLAGLAWRASRQGASAARIAARHGGRPALVAQGLYWAVLGTAQALLRARARLAGDRRQALYRFFVLTHARSFLCQAVPALLPGGKGRGGPLFRVEPP